MADPGLPSRPQRTRRTRFVCISDTHNCTVRLPKGDVLIHCGDLTNQGSFGELSKQVQWLENTDFECKIVVAGNHDLTLDTDFCNTYMLHGYMKVPQVPKDCQALLTESKHLTYLLHESRAIRLISPSGPRTSFSVFGSPYSPVWGGAWAFQYPRLDDNMAARSLWGKIPLDTDVLITHGPAHTHCDESRTREAAGCEILRQELWRVRPRLALCGHIHEARGVERVRWDLESKNSRYAELGRTAWQDPNPDSEKNALVDLSAKGGCPLENDGSLYFSGHTLGTDRTDSHQGKRDAERDGNVAYLGIGTLGLGENPDSARSDQAALKGRLGRKETCIINCAIQSSSYPHSGRGPRKLNKPIVVDLDLPVWEDEEPQEDVPNTTL
ncbi:putative calcineurin-like phosphoesterase [Rosellinia necatrix]|uniref:Putative calcineurin-like phosphoesterase n=1 Tax=Rosellinia necatrix TaxID=77044 RepID=A0A1W2TVI3_ROSNE|nr:putative calcineurin-like phosphoesterase [Rosellinia necatrix]